MRPTAMIHYCRRSSCRYYGCQTETEKFPANNIVKLVKSYRFTSHFYKVNMKDFVSSLMCETTAPTAPIVKVMEEEGQKNIHIYVYRV